MDQSNKLIISFCLLDVSLSKALRLSFEDGTTAFSQVRRNDNHVRRFPVKTRPAPAFLLVRWNALATHLLLVRSLEFPLLLEGFF